MLITITVANALNVSCQIGDTAYYVTTTSSGGFNINSSSVVEIGIITAIPNNQQIVIGNSLVASVPSTSFILFSKDNKANMSSVLGYHATVKFTNNSMSEAELFSVGLEAVESSK